MATANRRRITIRSSQAATLATIAVGAGWLPVAQDADLTIVDLRDAGHDPFDGAGTTLAIAAPGDRQRLVAAAAAGAAFGVMLADPEDLVPALAFAASRLDLERRADHGTALADFLAAQDAGDPLVAIHVEIVRLDLVNAAHGRRAGTALVSAVSERIGGLASAMLDHRVATARLRGPAIGVLVAAPPDEAVLLAARIDEALARPVRIGGATVPLGIAIGIADRRPDDDLRTLLARAERAQRDDAAGGRDDALAIDVRRAMAHDEIAIVFQPQARLADDAITGVEALARWHHPERGALGAAALFAAAATAGLGVPLSEHIQRVALRAAAAWRDRWPALRLSLNVTAPEFANPRFADRLLDRVDASGFPRARLTLELTETDLMADLAAAAGTLAALRRAGLDIAIDDFGTGYSSLAYLKALPVDYIKLDKALVDGVGSERGAVVVRGAIEMARSLGIGTIAEGVESPAQRRALTEVGCAAYQGFLLSPPVEPATLIAFVEQRRMS